MVLADLFAVMMKEEWRIHSTLFGSLSFALFPLCICGIAFMGMVLAPLLPGTIPAGTLVLLIHGLYLLLGIMAGGFGLMGREIISRRFGEAGLVAPAARYLPLSDRTIFGVFVLKDTVYYLLLWVLPFVAGISLAGFLVPLPGSPVATLAVTIPLAFLSGLALVFLLTTIYARSRLFLAALGVAVLVLAVAGTLAARGTTSSLNPVLLVQEYLLQFLIFSVAGIITAFSISLAFPVTKWNPAVTRYPERYSRLKGQFSLFRSAPLMAKDFLELFRNGGLVGQTLFSLALPLALIWVALSLLSGAVPADKLFFLFAVVAGVIGSTIYTWITEFDSLPPYTLLPLDLPALIRAKTRVFHILLVIPGAIVLIAGLVGMQWSVLLPAVITMAGTACYLQVVMALLAGLRPSVLIYDARVFVASLVLSSPAVMSVVTAGLLIGPASGALVALFLAPVAALLFRTAIQRAGTQEIGTA